MKPYIIAHMAMTIDGKASGSFLNHPAFASASEYYYGIHRELRTYCDGFACGRETMEGSFTNHRTIDLTPYEGIEVPPGDYMSEKSDFYAICFDTYGRVGWTEKYITDEDPGYNRCAIVEVLTHRANPAYLAYLRSIKVNYIFAGDDTINLSIAMRKLKTLFRIQTLILEGGPDLNQSFQNEGMIDDLSLIIAPITAGKDAKSVFGTSINEEYVLIHHRIHDDGSIYLRYSKA